ncbi:MAG: hypothetical protein KC416_17285, partial [Myxococcales bacterium]|nr:hypothetical protein [Myxococcales bacterium]
LGSIQLRSGATAHVGGGPGDVYSGAFDPKGGGGGGGAGGYLLLESPSVALLNANLGASGGGGSNIYIFQDPRWGEEGSPANRPAEGGDPNGGNGSDELGVAEDGTWENVGGGGSGGGGGGGGAGFIRVRTDADGYNEVDALFYPDDRSAMMPRLVKITHDIVVE